MGISAKVVGIVEIVVGVVLTALGAGAVGVPLIIAGVGQTAAALLAPDQPDPVDRLDQRRRPGIRNRINSPNRPIPVCYGRTVIDSPPVIYGPDLKDVFKIKEGEQYQTPGRIRFKAAWGLCMGEITAVERIFTQDNLDLNDILKKGDYTVKLGSKDQTPIDDIAKQVRYLPTAIDIDKFDDEADTSIGESDNSVVITTSDEIESFGLVVANPRGLFFKETADTRKGAPGPKGCRLLVYYKKTTESDSEYKRANHDQGGRADYDLVRTIGAAEKPNGDVTTLSSEKGNTPYWNWGGVMVVPIRREFEASVVYSINEKTYKQVTKRKKNGTRVTKDALVSVKKWKEARPLVLPRAKYNIKIENRTQSVYNDDVDDIQIIGVEEITFDEKTRFPNIAYVFINTESTNNLERNFLNMRFIVHGRKVVDLDAYNTSSDTTRVYSDNCANVVADVLTDPLIGLGYSLDDIDLTSFLTFYDYCEESLELSEWRTDTAIATGNPNTYYVLEDFNESSEIDFVTVNYKSWDAADYVQTATGIQFRNNIPNGLRKNPAYGIVPGATKKLDPDTIVVRYRTNVKRGAVSATFDEKTSYDEIIKALLDPLGAYLYMKGGKWAIAVDKDETSGTISDPTPVLDLDVQDSSYVLLDSDGTSISDRIKSSITFSTNPRRLESNTVRVKYLDGENNFRDDVVIVEDVEKVATDGVQVLEVSAQTISTRKQAEEYAAQLLRTTSIDDSVIQIRTTPIGQWLVPGDIIRVTDDRRSWSNQLFRISNVRINPVPQGMSAEITAIPYNDEKYNKDIKTVNTRRVAPGTAHQSQTSGGYLVTSSARDASFRVVR